MEDIERALNFYQNTLGFSVIKQDGPWAEVDANGLNIGLMYPGERWSCV